MLCRIRSLPLLTAAVAFGTTLASPARTQVPPIVNMHLTAPNAPGGGTVTAFGYYMSPYGGTVNGQVMTLNCVDFFDQAVVGDAWRAYETPLDGSSSLSFTKFDNLQLYQEAAWLTTQFASNPATAPERTVAIQTAIWNLFSGFGSPDPPTVSGQPTDAFNTAFWVTQAGAHYTDLDGNLSNFFVLSDVNNAEQEYIVSATPEPATVALVATGLLLLIGLSFWRRRSRDVRGLAARFQCVDPRC